MDDGEEPFLYISTLYTI